MDVPWAALAPLLVLGLGFVAYCLVDLSRSDVKHLPRWAWAAICVLSLPLGGIGIIGSVGRWLPAHLVGALSGIPAGEHRGEYVPAAGVTVIATGLCLWLAVRWSGAREL